jgi:hypothetical protein
MTVGLSLKNVEINPARELLWRQRIDLIFVHGSEASEFQSQLVLYRPNLEKVLLYIFLVYLLTSF